MLEINAKNAENISALLKQLSERAEDVTEKNLAEIVKQDMRVLCVWWFCENDQFKNVGIVGMASIYFRQTLMGKFGIIEDVVVSESYLGKGIGDKLIRALIEEAKKRGVKYIELTCNPRRIAAKKLYQKHGFKLVAAAVGEDGTNYYRLYL